MSSPGRGASEGVLFVPVNLDALFLEREKPVLEAMADFSRLPFHGGAARHDVNADVAYVSEEIVSHPFRDQGLLLGAGVHLHVALIGRDHLRTSQIPPMRRCDSGPRRNSDHSANTQCQVQ